MNSIEDIIYPSNLKRIINLIIDLIVGPMLMGFAIGVFCIIIDILGLNTYNTILGMPDILLNIACYCLYYFIFEMMFSKSIGKMLTGTKVIHISGERVKAQHILLRTLCRLIPFEAFSFIEGTPGDGFHDKFSKTLVIDSREMKKNKQVD